MAGTITHQWTGTVLTITSDSGTSSCDLKGAKGDDGPRGAQGAPGSSVAEDSQKLGGVAAENYALKTDTVENANKLGNVAAAQYVLKTDTVENANKLGNVAAAQYALKTDTIENANKLGNVAAESYALKTDVAPDSAMLGGKAPAYYLQPRNLLDNSDFTNPVNQRGSTSYSTQWTYTIDRWYLPGSTVPVTVGEGYVSFCTADQFISKEIKDGYYTAAIKLLDGRVFSGSAYYTAGESVAMLANNGVIDCYLMGDAGSSSHPRLRFQTVSGEAISFVWAALYEGSYTADTLPPYFPKGYAAELAECMRYYQKFQMLTGTGASAAQRVFVVLPVAMRIMPTIAYELISGDQPKNVIAQAWNIIDVTGAESYSHLSISLSADL